MDLLPRNESLIVSSGVYEEDCIPYDATKAMLIGDSEFTDMVYKYRDGTTVPITLQPYIDFEAPSNIKNHLEVNILTNPSAVKLRTQK